jgi:hypothetical protein
MKTKNLTYREAKQKVLRAENKKPNKLTGWKAKLIDLVSLETGCEAQHNGSPCNTCFHSKFCEELGNDIGHLFWGVVLVARGDYSEKDIMKQYKVVDLDKKKK